MRAVGRANGDNRLSIIVPCHRVIGADGALTGYGGGLWRKQKLLDHERSVDREALMPARSLALLIALAALWGGSFVFMRYAVPAMGPVPLAFARVTLAALALLAFAAAQRNVPDLRTRWRGFAVVGLVNSALPFVLFCYAEQTITASTRRHPQRDESVLRRDRRRDLARRAVDRAQARRHDAGTRSALRCWSACSPSR